MFFNTDRFLLQDTSGGSSGDSMMENEGDPGKGLDVSRTSDYGAIPTFHGTFSKRKLIHLSTGRQCLFSPLTSKHSSEVPEDVGRICAGGKCFECEPVLVV